MSELFASYKPYQHIEKIALPGGEINPEVDGILNGTVYLSYKIDGSNGCIWYNNDKDCLEFGSRKRQLSLDSKDSDNQNFMKLMTSPEYHDVYMDLFNFLCRHKHLVIYGEWLVPVTIKRYKNDAWKQFYVFDVYDLLAEAYWSYDDYKKVFDADYPHIKYIPLLAKLENPTIDDIKALLPRTNEFLITDGLGEGIVIKNYNYKNKYGRITWAKMLTAEFQEQKKTHREQNRIIKETGEIEYELIKILTREQVSKEQSKIIESRHEEFWRPQMTLELLNRVWEAFITDNMLLIIKKYHNPTINFAKLRKICDDFVKQYLNNI